MPISLEPATLEHHLDATLAWLKEKADAGEGGFYCTREVIRRSFSKGNGICAIHDGVPIGFVVFQRSGDESAIHIVEVHPRYRRRGIADQLMVAAIGRLRDLGAHCVDVECTTPAGEALCRHQGFEDYQDDPRNYRAPYADPTLRKYLTDWRPKPRHPWN